MPKLICGTRECSVKSLLAITPCCLEREEVSLVTVLTSFSVRVTRVMSFDHSPEAFLIKQMSYTLVSSEEGELLAGL